MAWYGWIPILTDEIPFEYFISRFVDPRFLNVIEIKSDEEIGSINRMLSKFDCNIDGNSIYYEFRDKFDDPPKNESIIKLSVKDDKVTCILMFNTNNELESVVSCNIKEQGLLEMNIKYQGKIKLEQDIIRPIYIIIRDIYHHHTYHEDGIRHGDLLLRPVFAKNEGEAIKTINKRFQFKIINHLKLIKASKLIGKLNVSSELITTAKGEMVYALSFIERFKSIFDNDYERYKFAYLNAIQAMDVLAEDMKLHYTIETDEKLLSLNKKLLSLNENILSLSNLLVVFTVFIGVVTFIIALDASFGTVDNLVNFGILKESYKSIWLVLVIWIILIVLFFIIKRFFLRRQVNNGKGREHS